MNFYDEMVSRFPMISHSEAVEEIENRQIKQDNIEYKNSNQSLIEDIAKLKEQISIKDECLHYIRGLIIWNVLKINEEKKLKCEECKMKIPDENNIIDTINNALENNA